VTGKNGDTNPPAPGAGLLNSPNSRGARSGSSTTARREAAPSSCGTPQAGPERTTPGRACMTPVRTRSRGDSGGIPAIRSNDAHAVDTRRPRRGPRGNTRYHRWLARERALTRRSDVQQAGLIAFTAKTSQPGTDAPSRRVRLEGIVRCASTRRELCHETSGRRATSKRHRNGGDLIVSSSVSSVPRGRLASGALHS
jgi:hypothetical protein